MKRFLLIFAMVTTLHYSNLHPAAAAAAGNRGDNHLFEKAVNVAKELTLSQEHHTYGHQPPAHDAKQTAAMYQMRQHQSAAPPVHKPAAEVAPRPTHIAEHQPPVAVAAQPAHIARPPIGPVITHESIKAATASLNRAKHIEVPAEIVKMLNEAYEKITTHVALSESGKYYIVLNKIEKNVQPHEIRKLLDLFIAIWRHYQKIKPSDESLSIPCIHGQSASNVNGSPETWIHYTNFAGTTGKFGEFIGVTKPKSKEGWGTRLSHWWSGTSKEDHEARPLSEEEQLTMWYNDIKNKFLSFGHDAPENSHHNIQTAHDDLQKVKTELESFADHKNKQDYEKLKASEDTKKKIMLDLDAEIKRVSPGIIANINHAYAQIATGVANTQTGPGVPATKVTPEVRISQTEYIVLNNIIKGESEDTITQLLVNFLQILHLYEELFGAGEITLQQLSHTDKSPLIWSQLTAHAGFEGKPSTYICKVKDKVQAMPHLTEAQSRWNWTGIIGTGVCLAGGAYKIKQALQGDGDGGSAAAAAVDGGE